MKNKSTTGFLFLVLGVLNIILKIFGLSILRMTETVVFSAIWFAFAIIFFICVDIESDGVVRDQSDKDAHIIKTDKNR